MIFSHGYSIAKRYAKNAAFALHIDLGWASGVGGPLNSRIVAREQYWIMNSTAPPKVKALSRMVGDKSVMRRYAQTMGLNLSKSYYDVPSIALIDFDALPENVVIKPNNSWSSNCVLIIKETELLTGANVPRSKLRDFCQQRFERLDVVPGVAPRILVEEFLHDYDQRFIIPRDFKVFVAGGRAWIIQVLDRNGPPELHNHSFYTREWTRIDDRFQTSLKKGPTFPKPELLSELLKTAEFVARDTGVFARLDFYLTTRGVVFGEFTAYPVGGIGFTQLGERYLCNLIDRFPDSIPDGWSADRPRLPLVAKLDLV
jgi:hypothetical protein